MGVNVENHYVNIYDVWTNHHKLYFKDFRFRIAREFNLAFFFFVLILFKDTEQPVVTGPLIRHHIHICTLV